MSFLEAVNVCKSFNDHPVLANIDLNLDQGRILCLLGPSGCGKTTLLRIIAGLEKADTGEIRIDNQSMDPISPHKRQFGMMFQEFALFPHKTVFDNIAFGIQVQKKTKNEINQRVQEIIYTVDLEGFEHRNVTELSGGERQRVALARSLAPEPRLLMLDEPLGALDYALRERLLLDMNRILRKVGVTTIWVTHDQSEAFAISDSIAVMVEGRIKQVSSPEKLYKKPNHKVVADFLGFHNILKGKITNENTIKTEAGLSFPNTESKKEIGRGVTILIRPEAARLIEPGTPVNQAETLIQCKLKSCLFKGRHYQISVDACTDQRLFFNISNDVVPPPPGDTVQLAINPSGVVMMPNE